ncbi:MAG: large conductance mechanosensitive channel protein MscL [Elusimicrobia bacterium]|nr:large conductance mechanosensitive channel protein MscL [Elusimicrobiota bacterium]
MIRELKEFAVKGNVVDMAVGIIIGAAFTSVVNSLVKDILNPLLGIVTRGVNFNNLFIILKHGVTKGPYASLAEAQADGALTVNIGLFISACISFTLVSSVLFFIVKSINKLKRPKVVTTDQITTKECSRCFSTINIKASRCPYCTSDQYEETK